MAIKFTLDHGGYVKSNGDIQIVGVSGDRKHGERGVCPEAHAHSKACAQQLLDFKPLLAEARTDDDGKVLPEVRDDSIRERMEKYFQQQASMPAAPTFVELPKKTIRAKNDKGKLVDKQVDDCDLS